MLASSVLEAKVLALGAEIKGFGLLLFPLKFNI